MMTDTIRVGSVVRLSDGRVAVVKAKKIGYLPRVSVEGQEDSEWPLPSTLTVLWSPPPFAVGEVTTLHLPVVVNTVDSEGVVFRFETATSGNFWLRMSKEDAIKYTEKQ